LGIKEIPANKTCTSVPQEWHKPTGDSIEPEPVMNRVGAFRTTQLPNLRTRDGFKEGKIVSLLQILIKCSAEKKEPSESFMKSIFESKEFAKISYIQHGKHNEVIVRFLYARKMQKQLHKTLL